MKTMEHNTLHSPVFLELFFLATPVTLSVTFKSCCSSLCCRWASSSLLWRMAPQKVMAMAVIAMSTGNIGSASEKYRPLLRAFQWTSTNNFQQSVSCIIKRLVISTMKTWDDINQQWWGSSPMAFSHTFPTCKGWQGWLRYTCTLYLMYSYVIQHDMTST